MVHGMTDWFMARVADIAGLVVAGCLGWLIAEGLLYVMRPFY